MPTNVSSRITLILLVLWASLSLIFPRVPPSLFWFLHPTEPISFRPDLKPGIDMVGGTSIIYEIKAPEGNFTGNLAEEVMQSLKTRVDPDGVRNLIWRPQGNRLEIQMPMSPRANEARAMREKFATAQGNLEATNIRVAEVKHAVETLDGEARANKIRELSAGSARRSEVLGVLSMLADNIEIARTNRDAAAEARHLIEYDKHFEMLTETNLPVSDLQRILDLPAELRTKELAALKERFAGFATRLTAMDEFVATYDKFALVRSEIDDASELKRLLRGSGVIEFHILANDLPPAEYQAAVERLQRRGPRFQSGELVRWYEVQRSQEVIEKVQRTVADLMRTTDQRERTTIIRANSEGNPQVEELFRSLLTVIDSPEGRRSIQKQIEDSLLIGHPLEEYGGKKWALAYVTPDKSMAHGEGRPKWGLQRAKGVFNQVGQRIIDFQFDLSGGMLFAQLTGNNLQKPLAIVLDDRVISAPNINSVISSRGEITGGGRTGFSESEQNYLAMTLTAGALPAQLTEEPISEQTVGPQIGADNLRRGMNACYFGLVVVAFFLIGYYYLAGVVAMIAVLMNMVLILAAMAGLNASFTLPGIAGIVLTIGMAVDANVLIFERLREEQVRGLSLRMALRNAYERAFSAILDGNLTTGITAAALYFFGSEEVKGFGLTLLLGIASSMFTALFVTKTIFAVLVDKYGVQQLGSLPLTYPKWDQALRPKIDWMSKAWMFYAFSSVFIVIGLTLFGIRWAQGQMLDIEFASGTAVQVQLKEPTPREELDRILSEASRANPNTLPAPTVVSVGDDRRTYEIITPHESVSEVKSAILAALGDRLNIALESKFDQVERAANEAMGQGGVLTPIEPSTTIIAGQSPADLQKHIGGVAIELRNIQPPVSKAEIENRIRNQRLQPQVGAGSAKRYSSTSVWASEDGKSAIVMASDADLPYDAVDPIRQQQWLDELAAPTWNLVRDALTKPSDLQKVTSFNPQVAGEAQRKALIAMCISLIAIMAYIWLRFGNLKYGTATVISLLHDTLFTLAAVGMAHLVVMTIPPLADLLLLEPFRINLNLVAAVLTVMGYSMNDTVVVFDRIRENRGKFGHVDRNVINDSINQTLSRTLLTGGTTILTIFVMYVWGGPGIHGFTFALLVGIVVGTYSSIAIAAPILLVGGAAGLAPSDQRASTTGRRQFQGA